MRASDAVAAKEARRYIARGGVDTETAVYVALIGAVAELRQGQREQAHELLETARQGAASIPWTMLVIDFLDSRLSAADLLKRAKSDGEKTEAHAYIAFKAQAELGSAYAARVGCSCRYVQGRSLESCQTDFEPGMEMVSLSDDPATKTVTGSVPLLASRSARFAGASGCLINPPD